MALLIYYKPLVCEIRNVKKDWIKGDVAMKKTIKTEVSVLVIACFISLYSLFRLLTSNESIAYLVVLVLECVAVILLCIDVKRRKKTEINKE